MHVADFGPPPDHIVANQQGSPINKTMQQVEVIFNQERIRDYCAGKKPQQILETGIEKRAGPPPVVI